MPRVAVIDMGSNSTRLLVADVDDGRVQELERETRITRLGAGRRRDRRLAGRGDRARARGAGRLPRGDRPPRRRAAWPRSPRAPCATPRTARSSAPLLRERFGFEARILSGDEEARLTFLGATAARPPGGDPVLVLDIGGGVTEFVVGVPGARPASTSRRRRARSARPSATSRDDPPPPDDLQALADEVARDHRGRGAARSCAADRPPGSPSPAPPRRSPRSTRSSTPMTRNGYTATGSPLRGLRGDPRPRSPRCPRPSGARSPGCTPTARRRSSPARDPDRGDARLRPRRDGDERGGHPPRRRAVSALPAQSGRKF